MSLVELSEESMVVAVKVVSSREGGEGELFGVRGKNASGLRRRL